jgi:phosphoribosylaminoimidazolecarboxamide formyltransferase / IMP cyclohydrolase
MPIRRALLSVSDKTDLVPFARGLVASGVELLSTGGTARALRAADLPVVDVADYTGSPEVFGGRVKTLHPRVHGGILYRRGVASDEAEAVANGIGAIDLVVCNLYPFAATVAKPDCTRADAIENIDIGGPSMVRSAAKNQAAVTVVVDPTDYDAVLAELDGNGGETTLATRSGLAAKAFDHTAGYDRMIADYLLESVSVEVPSGEAVELRYGENPHQSAHLLAHAGAAGPCGCEQLHGKALSYNNLLDLDAALGIIAEFDGENAVAVLKHNNPCGVARVASDDVAECFAKALACDPVSAFGGIVAVAGTVDLACAEAMAEVFLEVIVAPAFTEEALERLTRKKNLRLMRRVDGFDRRRKLRSVQGGVLVQDPDVGGEERREVVTQRAPIAAETAALELAWKVCKHVRSNAIVFANAEQAVGIGAGQMSRIDAAELAVKRCRLDLAGTAAASDAFFPFRDGLDAVAAAGATSVIQPGGSKRDGEVIAAADEQNMAMVFTGTRHFRH